MHTLYTLPPSSELTSNYPQVAGPVLSFRRPTPAFAFVEYSDAEAVLRCLEVVNGAQIKTKQGGDKTLLVKADEKTRARLDEYEKSRVKNEVRFPFHLSLSFSNGCL